MEYAYSYDDPSNETKVDKSRIERETKKQLEKEKVQAHLLEQKQELGEFDEEDQGEGD